MTDAEKQVLLNDPALFIVTYFPNKIEKLEDFHLRLITTSTETTRSLILYPAHHGKTTLVSTLLPIWALCKDPNVRIAIIAKSLPDAESIMTAIQAELVDNPELIRDFGPFRPGPDEGKPWALGKISVAKRTRRDRSATIAVFGSGSKQVLGYRTDWTICDDVVSQQNSENPEQRQKMRDWFDQAVITGPEFPWSRITVVGTRFDPGDLYGDLLEMIDPIEGQQVWATQREDAIVDEEDHLTLWPDRWPWKALMLRKAEVGTLNFNKRYRNIAVDASRMVFREEYIRGGFLNKNQYPGCLDRDYRVGDYADNWKRAAGLDPAVGGSRSAKFCGHAVLAQGSCKHHERCYWVVDLERQQYTLPQQVELVLRKHGEYGLMMSVIEANSYQAGLWQEIQRRMDEAGLAYKVDAHYTTRTNKPDPELGVQSMSPWFEHGKVHIPWGDDVSRRKMQHLVDELIQYPGRTTDTVMAFWFAWRALEVAAPKWQTTNRLQKQRPDLYRRLGRRVIQNPAYVQQEA